jgi:hypothetical protein
MRTSHFSLAAVLALAIAFPTLAAEKPRPPKRSEDQPRKIWTNEDMAQLRLRGLISVVGEPTNEAPSKLGAPSQPSGSAYASRLEDPDWYAQQAADLQAELDKRQAELRDAQEALAKAADGITEPGVAMDKGNVGVTPDAGIAILEAESLDIQRQLDDLSDLARQNNIPPSVLRG